jgi:hypothetical protein
VALASAGKREFVDVPLTHGHFDRVNMWGIGVVDMAYAILGGRPHRATGRQAFHVLDLMNGFLDSSARSTYYETVSTMERPAPLPTDLPEDALD